MNEIALLHAEAGSAPSGTGSYNYYTNCAALVDNLAYAKQVGIWGHTGGGWSVFPCQYDRSVPGNGEVWTAHVYETEIDQFALQYQVAGNVYWDNNGGYNYQLATGPAHTDGVGTVALNPNVLVVGYQVDAGGMLNVDILVRNLAYAKTVAIVYTTNGWASFQNAFAGWVQAYPPDLAQQVDAELWSLKVPVGVGSSGAFAAFYGVNGATYWDNNFNQNYSFA